MVRRFFKELRISFLFNILDMAEVVNMAEVFFYILNMAEVFFKYS